MNNLFNNILTDASGAITPVSAVISMLVSLLLGIVIAITYRKTQRDEIYQRSFGITLIMLPVILSVIILFIGSNIARAFSLAGTLSIIRFRSAPGDPKDIGFIFFDIAAGLACGVGLYGYGALFVAILCGVLIIVEKFGLFAKREPQRQLKITIPENLGYKGAFDDVFEKYTTHHTLSKIRTTDLGSLFELCYSVIMKNGADEQEFINDLRCRNGNLNIVISIGQNI